MKQVVVAVRRPLGGLQLGLRGHGPAYTMGQGLRRRDRRGQRQRDEGSRPERGETAWAREHSETKEDLLNGESELNDDDGGDRCRPATSLLTGPLWRRLVDIIR